MFVTPSNFDTPPYNLPNLDKVANTFLDYVNVLEEEVLVKLLGRQLYKSFIDALDALPDEYDEETATVIDQEYVYGNDIWKALTEETGVFPVAGPSWELIEEDNKWLELQNGAEYDYADKTWKWKGLVHLLVPFITSRYIRDNVDSFSGSAVIVPSNENSSIISPALRICRAHNAYAERCGVARGGSSLYYRDQSFRYECLLYHDTLFGFLTANREEYEVDGIVWYFESPELMNIAGI